MKNVELSIIQYAKEDEIKTRLVVDGSKIDSKDNRLTNLVVYQPMWKWLNPYRKKLFVWAGFLAEIIEEFNDKSINFVFHGCKADYTVFKKSILVQQMNLNRNGGTSQVAFEFADNLDHKKIIKELTEVLDDLRVEADNWGENDIIREIDLLKNDICNCNVILNPEYHSSDNFRKQLKKQHIGVKKESILTVIPVDGSVSVFDIRDFISTLVKENETDRKYLFVNTSTQENEVLVDAVVSLGGGNDSNIRYIENDGENYIAEIEKTYYLFATPNLIKRTIEILHRFPDYDTNNFLIDISDKIDDLFYIGLK